MPGKRHTYTQQAPAHSEGGGRVRARAETGRATPERQTRQRQAVRNAIEQAGAPVTPKDILEGASRVVDGIGLATVYRTLKLLVDAGEVATVDIPGEAPRYEIPKGHHHHFHCKGCGRVYELEGCCGHFSELTPSGFRLDGHELMLFGRCKTCAKGGTTGPRTEAPARVSRRSRSAQG